MPFQPDSLSPDALRRLAMAQRRALTRALHRRVTAAQAQAIVAQTLGHATWAQALAQAGREAAFQVTPLLADLHAPASGTRRKTARRTLRDVLAFGSAGALTQLWVRLLPLPMGSNGDVQKGRAIALMGGLMMALTQDRDLAQQRLTLATIRIHLTLDKLHALAARPDLAPPHVGGLARLFAVIGGASGAHACLGAAVPGSDAGSTGAHPGAGLTPRPSFPFFLEFPMPFQPDQMSPDTLRRLVKTQRRALAKVLNVDVPQHQAQEIVAQTLGYASWHEALTRVGQPATALAAPSSQALVSDAVVEAILTPRTAFLPPMDLFRQHWQDAQVSVEGAPILMIQGMMTWLTLDVTRWLTLTAQERPALIQRVRRSPSLGVMRDGFLEAVWAKRDVAGLFASAAALIPGDQLWPWLHRAARAERRDLMDVIHAAHERAIGSEPFHALHNAVYARDKRHVERLIEIQCQRYGLDINDHGGEQRTRTARARHSS